jgi:DNA-binding NtrC family response regulator
VRGRVLLVEGDQSGRAVHRRWLAESGYAVEAVTGEAGCLDAIRRAPPDAVLLDVTPAGSHGADVLGTIGGSRDELPVIVLTSESAIDSAVAAMQLGAYDFLVEPIERTRLLASVRNAVERRRLNVRLSQLEGEEAPALRLEDVERIAIEKALRRTNGNVSEVVRQLGIGRTTLYRKLKKYRTT